MSEAMEQFKEQIDRSTSEKVSPIHPKKRPSLSYVALIAQAIQSAPGRKMRLSDIYEWITNTHPYFGVKDRASWRNSVRHNLSLNECFVKIGRDQHGKGHYWRVHPANESDFARGDFRRRKARMKVKESVRPVLGTGFIDPTASRHRELEALMKVRRIYDSPSYCSNNWPLCRNGLFCGYESMTLVSASLGTLANMFGLEVVTSESERKWIVKSKGKATPWHHKYTCI